MSEAVAVIELTQQDWADLRRAKTILESPGLTGRLAGVIGAPIERGFELLPRNWSVVVHRATQLALTRALNLAVKTLDRGRPAAAANRLHQVLVGISGGLGGALGLAALPVELPVSTVLMFRSIADVARSEGHSLNDLETRLSCLEVFALGGRSQLDDAADNAYWAMRAVLAKAISDAASALAHRGMAWQSAPPVLRFISAVAARFGVVVSEQVAAKAVPVVGAAAGATINVLFLNHFQTVARGHFIVKRLEARYGAERIRQAYDSIAMPMDAPR